MARLPSPGILPASCLTQCLKTSHCSTTASTHIAQTAGCTQVGAKWPGGRETCPNATAEESSRRHLRCWKSLHDTEVQRTASIAVCRRHSLFARDAKICMRMYGDSRLTTQSLLSCGTRPGGAACQPSCPNTSTYSSVQHLCSGMVRLCGLQCVAAFMHCVWQLAGRQCSQLESRTLQASNLRLDLMKVHVLEM
jgi:hypothetical protein